MSTPDRLTDKERDRDVVELATELVASHRRVRERAQLYDAATERWVDMLDDALAARLAAQPPATDRDAIAIPRPAILTGPAHQTVDEATTAYLREAAGRVRKNRYWGSGVTDLVADVLDDVAAALAARPAPDALADRVQAKRDHYARLLAVAIDPDVREWLPAFIATLDALLAGRSDASPEGGEQR